MKGLSLFSCTGIGEYYLSKNNIDICVANELLEDRAKFYSHNYPDTDMIVGDVSQKEIYNKILKSAKKNKIEFILATPPCQGMSQAGKMDENDPRNLLFLKVVEMIKDLKPNCVLIENVPRFLKTSIIVDGEVINTINYLNKKLSDKYFINYKVINASDYGSSQNRKRAIVLISSKNKKEWLFPEKKEKTKTVRDVIGKLPSLESGESSNLKWHSAKKHNDNHILWMKNTPTGKTAFDNKVHYPQKEDGTRIKGFKTTYKRIEWDNPSPTITMANESISSQNNVHPGRLKKDGTYSDARVLTILELILLTGLDKKWKIPDWASENFIRNILGEQVPPLLVYELTKCLKE